LESISIQTFRDFEVVVTDDSPGSEVKSLCEEFDDRFKILYSRNESSLGTPANWNAAIKNAGGEWIKLMHDDDWFGSSDSLGVFAQAVKHRPDADFFFSAYTNQYLGKNRSVTVRASASRRQRLSENPVTLFSSNIIGPPSVVLHRNDRVTLYDESVKWVVDIDFYIRFLANRRFYYLDRNLINVGIGDEQVTVDCFRQRTVEVPEAFHLFQKTGFRHLRNVLVFDGWWRLLRNLEIRRLSDITQSGFSGDVPAVIRSMIRWQSLFPLKMLRFGPVSKFLMFLNYIYNKRRIV
jgi:glycosyltransferase involved in cell wall biosynthesis